MNEYAMFKQIGRFFRVNCEKSKIVAFVRVHVCVCAETEPRCTMEIPTDQHLEKFTEEE